MAGVFFRTALLDYVLYRQYFPLHALGLYEQRRRAAGSDEPLLPDMPTDWLACSSKPSAGHGGFGVYAAFYSSR